MAKAINPYDFIPFGEGPARKPLDEYYQGELESGWIDVRLTVKTPLIIPDASHPKPNTVIVQKMNEGTGDIETKEYVHKSYDFFKDTKGHPAIPGSSLRGMLRSVYEAASNSCLPFVQSKPITQRGVTYSSFKERGLLEYDPSGTCWNLYKAKAYKYKTTKSAVSSGQFNGFDNGSLVWFLEHSGKLDPTSLTVPTSSSAKGVMLEGILQFNIPAVNGNYNIAVLEPQGTPLLVWNLHGKAADVEEQLNPYQMLHAAVHDAIENITGDQAKRAARGKATPGAAQPMEALRSALETAAKKGGMVPCYYMEVKRGTDSIYHLSPASIGRVRQRRSWSEIMGAYSTCTNLDKTGSKDHHALGVCPACALFGTTEARYHGDRDDGSVGSGGRLRFTDAKPDPDKEPVTLVSYTLPILEKPKPTAFEFYLRKPASNASFWNYDFYGIKKRDGGANYAEYYDLEAATPRGRKMYWHGKPQTVELSELERPDLNSTMEAAEPGSEFVFRIYFDNITAQQRMDLLWILELGDNRVDSMLQHKLGHAKPVGYGSVKLTVEGCTRRTVRLEPKTSVVLEPLPLEPEAVSFYKDSRAFRSLLQMCDASMTENYDVAYPLGQKNGNTWSIYEWFSHNRTNPAFTIVLPEPLEAKDKLAIPTNRTTPNTDFQQTVLTQDKLNEENRKEARAAEEAAQAAARAAEAALEFEQAKARYPIGTELEVTVINVINSRGHNRLFFELDGVSFQGTAVYTSGSYKKGKTVKLRIIGTGENKEGFPNFVAEIVS